ncbi:MAG: DUF1648 domain-containing protein [Dehalobacterium sp.]
MTGKTLREKSNRPVIDLPRTFWDWFFDAASLAGLSLIAGFLLRFWPVLPETIPTHFGFSGQPDAWGSKTTLLILPLTGLVLYVILTGVGFFPHTYNYLWAITEKNARTQYKLAQALIGCLKTEIVWLFSYMVWKTMMISLGKAEGMGKIFVIVFLGIIFGTLGLYFYCSAQAR